MHLDCLEDFEVSTKLSILEKVNLGIDIILGIIFGVGFLFSLIFFTFSGLYCFLVYNNVM